jgi:hypothetical protein
MAQVAVTTYESLEFHALKSSSTCCLLLNSQTWKGTDAATNMDARTYRNQEICLRFCHPARRVKDQAVAIATRRLTPNSAQYQYVGIKNFSERAKNTPSNAGTRVK